MVPSFANRVANKVAPSFPNLVVEKVAPSFATRVVKKVVLSFGTTSKVKIHQATTDMLFQAEDIKAWSAWKEKLKEDENWRSSRITALIYVFLSPQSSRCRSFLSPMFSCG